MVGSGVAKVGAALCSLLMASTLGATKAVSPSQGIPSTAATPADAFWMDAAQDGRFDFDFFFDGGSLSFPFESSATISVTEPTSDSIAVSGEEYTVEFDYDDGFGGRVGRFQIDLYTEGGSGDCGTWLTSICDKPDIGCRDTQGDYDVIIPTWITSGMYKIRIGVFGDETVYACSETFEIMSVGDASFI